MWPAWAAACRHPRGSTSFLAWNTVWHRQTALLLGFAFLNGSWAERRDPQERILRPVGLQCGCRQWQGDQAAVGAGAGRTLWASQRYGQQRPGRDAPGHGEVSSTGAGARSAGSWARGRRAAAGTANYRPRLAARPRAPAAHRPAALPPRPPASFFLPHLPCPLQDASRLVFVSVKDAKPKRKVAVPVPDNASWDQFLRQVGGCWAGWWVLSAARGRSVGGRQDGGGSRGSWQCRQRPCRPRMPWRPRRRLWSRPWGEPRPQRGMALSAGLVWRHGRSTADAPSLPPRSHLPGLLQAGDCHVQGLAA